MPKIERITIENFKSINKETLELVPLNVFIGANGSGKSNLIGIFHFLSRVIKKELQTYTGQTGGANNILFFGRKQSSSLSIKLEFLIGSGSNGYAFELVPTAQDSFIFSKEIISFHDRPRYPSPYEITLGSGHKEAAISDSSERVAKYVRACLESYCIYHFHDTSHNAKVKQKCDVEDNRNLLPDAGNLAAFLFRLKKTHPDHFMNIEDTVRNIAPFFERFQLEPSLLNPDKIMLEWKEKGSDVYFNAHALSDGTLRFICLATLMLQPKLPSVILLDEPELGLHPAAITLLAALLQSTATRTQILVATQSVTLVNQLSPEHVWIAERESGASRFTHLAKADLSIWLDGYALGELWEKNILGGRP